MDDAEEMSNKVLVYLNKIAAEVEVQTQKGVHLMGR